MRRRDGGRRGHTTVRTRRRGVRLGGGRARPVGRADDARRCAVGAARAHGRGRDPRRGSPRHAPHDRLPQRGPAGPRGGHGVGGAAGSALPGRRRDARRRRSARMPRAGRSGPPRGSPGGGGVAFLGSRVPPLPPPPSAGEPLPMFVDSTRELFYPDATEIRQVPGTLGSGAVAAWIRLRGEVVEGEAPSQLQRVAAAGGLRERLELDPAMALVAVRQHGADDPSVARAGRRVDRPRRADVVVGGWLRPLDGDPARPRRPDRHLRAGALHRTARSCGSRAQAPAATCPAASTAACALAAAGTCWFRIVR